MKRRKFIKTGLLASAIPTIGGIIYGSSIKNSNIKKDPFNLLYAPHFGMFTNHSGNDLVDQIQFMYDMGFRSFEDNGMKERAITDQKRIAKIMNKLEMTMGVFVAHKIHWDFPNLTSGDKEYQDQFVKKHNTKLGFMSFFVKASVNSLQSFPHLNAELHQDELIVKKYYDIGIAVATDEGLVVPVLRGADKLSSAEIELGIAELATKSREKKITLQELQGGTFSITNGGVFGSLMSTPLLNPPQVGILGMHKIMEKPLAVDGEIVIRPVMMLAVTYDHRIIDGSMAVQFLVRIKNLLEDPYQLLIDA